MGCDIHFFAEYRKDANSPWEFLPAPDDGLDYEAENPEAAHPYRFGVNKTDVPGYKPGYDYRYWSPEETDPPSLRDWFDDRNYSLFGMLANVRNGRGFAGCDMGDAVEPILPAPHTRGWPPDCCPELEAERANIEHTPTWLTVAEMQAYFDRKRSESRILRGVVPGSVYEKLRDKGTLPESWSGGISGKQIVVVAPAIYDLIDKKKITHKDTGAPVEPVNSLVDVRDFPEGMFEREKEQVRMHGIMSTLRGGIETAPVDTKVRVYVRAQWTVPFDEATKRFEACLAEMVDVAGVAPENIRAVFYFDS